MKQIETLSLVDELKFDVKFVGDSMVNRWGDISPFTYLEYVVNKLVKVRFQWKIHKQENSYILTCGYSSKKLYDPDIIQHGNGTIIKMDLRSEELKYSQQGICPLESWSDWHLITKVIDRIENRTIYSAMCDFYISAYKMEMDMLSSKLYVDTDFTDFYLSTDEGSVAVHKACLAIHSEVFKAMLSGEWKEMEEGKIKLKGVPLQTLQHLKDYLYLGKIPEDGLRPLLLVARCYLIEDLVEHCIRQLAQTATGTDLYSLLEFACENVISELAFATLKSTQNSAVCAADKIRHTEKLDSTQSV